MEGNSGAREWEEGGREWVEGGERWRFASLESGRAICKCGRLKLFFEFLRRRKTNCGTACARLNSRAAKSASPEGGNATLGELQRLVALGL